MPDPLGIATQQDQEGTSLDYLGVRSPTAFRGQPALPTAGPIAGGAAPPTIAGAGTAPAGPLQAVKSGPLGETTFADLSGAVGGEGGAEGGPGGPSGLALGQGTALGVGKTFGPFSIGLGPTGTIGAGVNTGNAQLDSVINTALGLGFGQAGIPTSVNIPALIAQLTQSPVLSMISTALGAAGIPLTMVNLAHAFAKTMQGSTTSLLSNVQSALSDVDPTVAESAANATLEADAAASASARGEGFVFSSPEAAAIASAKGVQGISAWGGGYAIGQQGRSLGTAAGMSLGQGAPGTPEGPPAPMFESFKDLMEAIFGQDPVESIVDVSPTQADVVADMPGEEGQADVGVGPPADVGEGPY